MVAILARVNAPKCHAPRLFEGTAVEIVDGCRVLGSLIGNEKAYKTFKVNTAGKYANLLKNLGLVAKTSHQNAYAFFLTRGGQQKLICVSWTAPNSRNIFRDEEAKIQTHILPSFFDSPVSQSARRLYSLPTREGGLNIKEPIDYESQCAASLTACAPLEDEERANAHLTQERIMHDIRTARLNIISAREKDLIESLQTEQGHVIEMDSEKGAFNWLTALSLKL